MDAKTKAINYASIAFGAILGATVGFIIYQRTMARAKELEIEALEAGTAEGGLVVGNSQRGYSDLDGIEDTDAVALMGDDDISLWENDGERDGAYRDDFTEDEDVFASGDLEEEPRRQRTPKD